MSGAVRSYEITVPGFPPAIYCARSPAKARAHAFRDYLAFDDRTSFRSFLSMSRLRRVPNPPGVGDRIVVGGVLATRVLPVGQYTGFLRDGSDVVLLAHPVDVLLEIANA